MGYRRVIVGADGSKTSEAAVAEAAKLAAAYGAEVVIDQLSNTSTRPNPASAA